MQSATTSWMRDGWRPPMTARRAAARAFSMVSLETPGGGAGGGAADRHAGQGELEPLGAALLAGLADGREGGAGGMGGADEIVAPAVLAPRVTPWCCGAVGGRTF